MTTFKFSRPLILGFAITMLLGLGFDASECTEASQVLFGLSVIFLTLWLILGTIDAIIRIKNRIQRKLDERQGRL